jgi:hypothetical protein
MQDPSDSMEIADLEENGQSSTAGSPVAEDLAPDSDIDSTTASTVLAEVLPGVAVVFGEVPAELKPDLIDFGLVPAADRMQISTVLASIGNTATVAGNLGNAFASLQGLYRISDATQALLKAGGTLAIKDGANLGTVLSSGGLAQARFIPVTAVSKAQTAAAVGPALAMVALQMQLSEITGLVRTNIALTSQVLTTIRNEQWAELTGLVATVDRAVDQARTVGSVPTSLWDSVAGSEASLRKQLDLYRLNVRATSGRSIGPAHIAAVSISRRTPRRSSSTPTPCCPPSRHGPGIRQTPLCTSFHAASTHPGRAQAAPLICRLGHPRVVRTCFQHGRTLPRS